MTHLSRNESSNSSTNGSVACTMVDKAPTPKTYRQAWVVLFFLVFLRTSVSVFQFTFSVVPGVSAEFFHVSLTAINWLSNSQGLVYVFVSFFTGWIFEKWGVKRSLIAAGAISTFGAGLRYVAVIINPPSFALTMLGQVIGSIAAPLSLNITTKFASTWFTQNMRATAGMFVASNYGAILGMFVIPPLVTDVSKIPMMTLMVVILSAVSFVPLLVLPSKPPSPPSTILIDPHSKTDSPSFFQGLRTLGKNSNFCLLFLVHGLNVGNSIALGTIFTQIISPFGYTDAQAGQLNAVSFFAGTLGCSVAGPVLDLTKQHKLFLKLIAPMVMVTSIGYVFLIQPNAYASVLFVTCLNQFFLSFLVPVVIELGSETSYPVADATTNSILWQGAQVFGFLIVLVMDYLRAGPEARPPHHMHHALIFQAVLAVIMTLLAFGFRGRMARSDAIRLAESTSEKESLPHIK